MSLLTIVSEACRRIGIGLPVSVVGSAEQTFVQMLGLANEEGQALANRFRWQALIREATFKTLAQEDQGAIQALAPGYYSGVLNDTLWNMTQQRPVFGPIGAAKWQTAKGRPYFGPYIHFRIRGNRLRFLPVPAAGEDVSFEYHSRAWATSVDGYAYRTAWGADDDVAMLDEGIMAAGLVWRWKQVKGLEYSEDFAKYERMVLEAEVRDVPATTLDARTGWPRYDGRYYGGMVVITPPVETPPTEPPVGPPVEPPVGPDNVLTTLSAQMVPAYASINPQDLITRGEFEALLDQVIP